MSLEEVLYWYTPTTNGNAIPWSASLAHTFLTGEGLPQRHNQGAILNYEYLERNCTPCSPIYKGIAGQF